MKAKTIQKYKGKSLPSLIAKATKHFNKFIRERDKGKPCISCGKYTTLQAGHFYSGGHYSGLRFNPDNVWGQCLRCNYYLSGDLSNYRKNLIARIGIERVEKLDNLAAAYKRTPFKWDRFSIISIITEYQNK